MAVLDGHAVICDNRQLPFRSGSNLSLRCIEAFEYVIDDQLLMCEVARILAPGGSIAITVPNTHGLGRFDGLNAYRYLRDTRGRGHLTADLAETGWRRHYAPRELSDMMRHAGLQQVTIQSEGWGLQEIGTFAGALLGRLPGRAALHSPSEQPASTGRPGRHLSVPAQLGSRILATAIRSG